MSDVKTQIVVPSVHPVKIDAYFEVYRKTEIKAKPQPPPPPHEVNADVVVLDEPVNIDSAIKSEIESDIKSSCNHSQNYNHMTPSFKPFKPPTMTAEWLDDEDEKTRWTLMQSKVPLRYKEQDIFVMNEQGRLSFPQNTRLYTLLADIQNTTLSPSITHKNQFPQDASENLRKMKSLYLNNNNANNNTYTEHKANKVKFVTLGVEDILKFCWEEKEMIRCTIWEPRYKYSSDKKTRLLQEHLIESLTLSDYLGQDYESWIHLVGFFQAMAKVHSAPNLRVILFVHMDKD